VEKPEAKPEPAAASRETQAARALRIARMYLLNKRPDLAKPKLEAVVKDFAGTKAAAQAAQLLERVAP
jgi:hypothetical protein